MGPDAVITGCIGGMTSSQASMGNEGIWLGVLSEIRKWRSPEGEYNTPRQGRCSL